MRTEQRKISPGAGEDRAEKEFVGGKNWKMRGTEKYFAEGKDGAG